MSESVHPPSDGILPFDQAVHIVSQSGLNGLRLHLDEVGIEGDSRVQCVQRVYDEAWRQVADKVVETDDALGTPTQRILGVMSRVWQMRGDSDEADIMAFAFFLRHIVNDEAAQTLFGTDFASSQQQRFDAHLYDLCSTAWLCGESPTEPYLLSRYFTKLLEVTVTLWSMNRDIEDFHPTEDLELGVIRVITEGLPEGQV